MYKVFIKDSSVLFTDKPDPSSIKFENGQQLFGLYKKLLQKSQDIHVTLYHHDLQGMWESCLLQFKIIEAAGGVVLNANSEVLLIYRLGKWDLPKGKLEAEESPELAAVREVMEECSIPEPSITKTLPQTYHTYELNGETILKRTYWFEMRVPEIPDLTPQTEEDITAALWCRGADLEPKMENTYANISMLLQLYQG